MTTEHPSFTVAIPTFNRVDSVSRRVEEFLALDFPGDVRLLVIDNNSPDRTYEHLVSNYGTTGVRVLANEENVGFAGNFLRLIDETQTTYLTVFSDEDRLHAGGFGRLMDLCQRVSPIMVSPRAQAGRNQRYRGRPVTRLVRAKEFESASFYLSGLTFESQAARYAARTVSALVPTNSVAAVYPQVLIAALLVAQGSSYFIDALVSSQSEVLETAIVETSGAQYNSVWGRWSQFKGFEEFFDLDHPGLADPDARRRMGQMREQIRVGVLDLLMIGAAREMPAIKPYLERRAPRTLTRRIARELDLRIADLIGSLRKV